MDRAIRWGIQTLAITTSTTMLVKRPAAYMMLARSITLLEREASGSGLMVCAKAPVSMRLWCRMRRDSPGTILMKAMPYKRPWRSIPGGVIACRGPWMARATSIRCWPRGSTLGFFGSSDNHDGWMGNIWTTTRSGEVGTGLAALLLPSLDRAAVFEALAMRRTYATTGARIIVHFDVFDGGEQLAQGTVLVAMAPHLRWEVHGTAPLATVRLVSLEIREGAEPVDVLLDQPDALDFVGELDPPWTGLPTAYWLEVVQADAHKAWVQPHLATAGVHLPKQRIPAGFAAAVRPHKGAGASISGPWVHL